MGQPSRVARHIADLALPHSWTSGTWERPDVLFHLAGTASVAGSVQDPAADFTANVTVAVNMLEYARAQRVGTVIVPSSAAVYVPNQPMPLGEGAAVGATSPYGAAKLAVEGYSMAYSRCYGIDVRVVRLFNVYGPRMRQMAIHDLVRKMLAAGTEVELLGDGEQLRDFLHCSDAARALVAVAERGERSGIYNAGSGVGVRMIDLASTLRRLLRKSHVKLRCNGQSRPEDALQSVADVSRIAALGFAPQVSLHDGLAETVEGLRTRYDSGTGQPRSA